MPKKALTHRCAPSDHPSAATRLVLAVLTTFLVTPPALAWPYPRLLPSGGECADDDFPEPPALRPAVSFWRDIFSVYTTNQAVLHDRRDLQRVWRVVPLPRRAGGRIDHRRAQPIIRREIADVASRLRHLQRTATVRDEGDRALAMVACGRDEAAWQECLPEVLRGAVYRIRAQRGVADQARLGVARARVTLDVIRSIFAEEGVPTELAALALVESTYDPTVRSSVGAAGIWQLMPATARRYGLQVSGKEDERFDVNKATRAAAQLLRSNYRLLGTWPLAITAYNHGERGVARGVREVGSTDLTVLIERYHSASWGFASRNFYAEFLAAKDVLEQLEQRGPDAVLALQLSASSVSRGSNISP